MLPTRLNLVIDWLTNDKNIRPGRIKNVGFGYYKPNSFEDYITLDGVKYGVYDVEFGFGGDEVTSQSVRLYQMEDEEAIKSYEK